MFLALIEKYINVLVAPFHYRFPRNLNSESCCCPLYWNGVELEMQTVAVGLSCSPQADIHCRCLC